ncbi:rhodanese-like domain-containing protein [Owenweeksia hongkongensis]|uniref:rhodanese-like domain-containing protein n=1 Tax=Owenweeksia hongkongensis TaxID=253245 RepID=UPI003A93B2FF
MNIRVQFYILGILFLLHLPAMAQKKVESKAYGIMLDGLLSDTVPAVSVKQLAKMDDVVTLDSRSKKEYNVSHMKNAIWVGYEDFTLDRVPENLKNQKLVVYCSVGARSQKVTTKLLEAGYNNVSNLYGGIFEWINQNHPVYNDEGETKKIHPYNFVWGLWLSEGEKSYD